jgi:hypothetical protein
MRVESGPVGGREASMRRWERERSRGREPFIWRRGVVAWGVPAALVTIGYKLYQEHLLSGGAVLTHQARMGIIVSAVVFPLCGYLFGRWLWMSSEREYQRFLVDEQSRVEGADGPRG